MPRLASAALIATALVLAAMGIFLLIAIGRLAGANLSVLLLFGLIGAFGLVMSFVVLWLFFEKRIFGPLIEIVRGAETALQGGEGEAPETGALPLLEPLSGGIATLARALPVSGAAGSGPAGQSEGQRRLEAILHDLSEGVIVCNLAHQVLLYNRVSLWLIAGAGQLGLGRAIGGLLEMAAIEEHLGPLVAKVEARGASPEATETVSFFCPLQGGERELPVRMTVTLGAGGQPDGYVLTFSAEAPPSPFEAPAPRDEFYDFDLFHRPLVHGFRGDTPLRDIGYVVFDTETTGLQPAKGDRLVAIAAVRVVNGRVLRNEVFEEMVNPERGIPFRASRVHGITDAQVADAPLSAEVLSRFSAFAEGSALVAHNAAFDMSVLEAEGMGKVFQLENPVLCTLLLSLAVHDHATGHGLDSVAARFGFTIRASERHTALGDALATADILVRFLGILDGRGVRTLGDAMSLMEKQAGRQRRLGF